LQFVFAVCKMLFGVALVGVVPLLRETHPLLAGWVGMWGIVFVLHFGVMHVLSVLWRAAGVDAQPIMNAPILAANLSEFWGQRWNLAFRQLAHAYVFRPGHARWGVGWATLVVFAISGLVHDLVITVPARGGYGLPTIYFLIQGVMLLVERSGWGKRCGLRRGMTGRLFAMAVVIGPLPLLYPPAFVERVILPTIAALGVS
jgi:alginate O-acetyltransferase complex protein AlgI